MKKTIFILSTLLVIACAILGFTFKTNLAKAMAGFINPRFSSAATTSPIFLAFGVSTSTQGPYSVASTDNSSMLVSLTASTSDTQLGWQYEYSDNGIDWFGEDRTVDRTLIASSSTNGSNTDHSTSTITHIWQPDSSTASTSYKAVSIPYVPALFFRVNFFLTKSPANARGAYWAAVNLKSNPGQ